MGDSAKPALPAASPNQAPTYSGGNYNTMGSTKGSPYAPSQALFNNFNYYYDPKTGLSTNPYYNKALADLQKMETMPSEYQQGAQMNRQAGAGLLEAAGYAAPEAQAARMQSFTSNAPTDWTTQQANQYMNPYIQTSLASQQDLANRQFEQQQQQLRGQQAGAGAFGGARGAILEQQNQLNQNIANQNLAAQGMNTAYNTALGAFQNQNQLNQANQQFNAQQQQAGSQANAGWQQQANLANQQANLNARQMNNQALTGAGTIGTNLAGIGQQIGNYNANLVNMWGQAGNTLQNVGEQYYQNQQGNAQALWGGVPTATAPAINTITGNQVGNTVRSSQQSTPRLARKGGWI